MLSAVKEDMSEVQRLKAVSDKYKAWPRYGNNGQLLTDSLGGGLAVCGGNARGYVFLSRLLGIKSVWAAVAPTPGLSPSCGIQIIGSKPTCCPANFWLPA